MGKIKQNHIFLVVILAFLLKTLIIGTSLLDIGALAIVSTLHAFLFMINEKNRLIEKNLDMKYKSQLEELSQKFDNLSNHVSSLKVAQGFRSPNEQKRPF